MLDVPDWPGHLAGQHVDVRLTAEDGYQAERSYSIASSPEDPHLAITVERIDDGEVSPYLTDELHPGDQLELRGPIGGYFVWDTGDGDPLLLLGGGSGLVPLMAMLRHRAAVTSTVGATVLVSAVAGTTCCIATSSRPSTATGSRFATRSPARNRQGGGDGRGA